MFASFSRVQSQHFVPVHFTMSRQAQHFVTWRRHDAVSKAVAGGRILCLYKKTFEGKRRKKSSIFSFKVFYTRREGLSTKCSFSKLNLGENWTKS